jgi:hypothetical protein
MPPAETTTGAVSGYTVADLCARWRVGQDKVLGMIRRNELQAVNLATNLSGRPQWRITPEAVAEFERRRTSTPTPKAKPAKRRKREEVDFFPD